MTDVQHVASLHPSTITAYAAGEPLLPASTRRSPVTYPVCLARYERAAVAAALDIAGGDPSRLSLNEDGSITILNASRSTYVQHSTHRYA